jgi:O-acetyl-ADP-ribose deacetylase (regulator of RNase III)
MVAAILSVLGLNCWRWNVKQISGNILDVTEGIIVQQVNCQGVMGAGLAKQIREKYPHVYENYRDVYEVAEGSLLGVVCYVHVSPKLCISSVFGQEYYGRNKNIVYTNYNALKTGLADISSVAQALGYQVYIPHGIGCGLANGDWNVVLSIIEETTPDAIIVKWGGES